jgi:hypothetical protein
VQGAEQDPGYQVALLAVTRDRRHDLVQVQVPREGAILVVLSGPRRPGAQQSRAFD